MKIPLRYGKSKFYGQRNLFWEDCVLTATNELEGYFCREHYGIEHIVSDERIYNPATGKE